MLASDPASWNEVRCKDEKRFLICKEKPRKIFGVGENNDFYFYQLSSSTLDIAISASSINASIFSESISAALKLF